MIKLTIYLNLLLVCLLSGCWRPEVGVLSDPAIEPYSPGSRYQLTKDFFIIKASSGVADVTAKHLLVGAGVTYGGRPLPDSVQDFDVDPDSFSDQIRGYLEQGAILEYVHTAFVTDWYSNTNIYYGVFELSDGESDETDRYMIRYGTLVPGRQFNPYTSIAPLEKSQE